MLKFRREAILEVSHLTKLNNDASIPEHSFARHKHSKSLGRVNHAYETGIKGTLNHLLQQFIYGHNSIYIWALSIPTNQTLHSRGTDFSIKIGVKNRLPLNYRRQ